MLWGLRTLVDPTIKPENMKHTGRLLEAAGGSLRHLTIGLDDSSRGNVVSQRTAGILICMRVPWSVTYILYVFQTFPAWSITWVSNQSIFGWLMEGLGSLKCFPGCDPLTYPKSPSSFHVAATNQWLILILRCATVWMSFLKSSTHSTPASHFRAQS